MIETCYVNIYKSSRVDVDYKIWHVKILIYIIWFIKEQIMSLVRWNSMLLYINILRVLINNTYL